MSWLITYLLSLCIIIPIANCSTSSNNNKCISNNNLIPAQNITEYDNFVKYEELYIGWTLSSNTSVLIGFQTPSYKLSDCGSWIAVGFTQDYNNANNSQIVVGSLDENCTMSVDSFTAYYNNDNNINNIVFGKFPNSIINERITQSENSTMIEFENLNLTRYDGMVSNIIYFSGNYNNYNNYNSRRLAGLIDMSFIDIIMKQQELSDLNTAANMIYLIFSMIFFITFIAGLIITHSNRISFRFINKNIDIPYYGYMPIGSVLFIIFYILWWTGLLIYSFLTNDVGQILLRLGLWISLNLSILLLPITRNSIWVILFDLSRERILYLHRILSIFCFISVVIKFVVVLIYFPPSFLGKIINNETGGSPLAGTYSTVCIILCSLFGIPFIRKNYFEFFYYSHRILSVLSIIFGCLHYLVTLYYIMPSLILYIIDIIVRYKHTHNSIYSKLQNVGKEKNGTACTFLTVTLRKNINTYPGCYFFICIQNDVARFQWHPLTLVSNKNDNLLFCAKNLGQTTWSGKLRKCIENNKKPDTDFMVNRKIKIQGPYGGHITSLYSTNKYKNIMLIAGGIGITPMISLSASIDEMYYTSKLTYLEMVTLIWIIPHESMLGSFESYLRNLDSDLFNIRVYITKPENMDEMSDTSISIFKIGRPDIKQIITDNLISNKKEKNLLLSCGPQPLSVDIKEICSKEGIDISSEVFE